MPALTDAEITTALQRIQRQLDAVKELVRLYPTSAAIAREEAVLQADADRIAAL